MILQALYDYYQRKAAEPDSGIAPEGFEKREIPFILVIGTDGLLKAIEDTREGEGKKKRAHPFLVPQQQGKRTMGIKPNLLWDNVEYALGANPRERSDVALRYQKFQERIRTELADLVETPAIKALLLFLEKQPIAQIEANPNYAEKWQEMLESNAFVAFRLDGSADATICDTVRPYLIRKPAGKNDGYCLITGQPAEIARLHAPIKGVRGANTTGAAVVSFNLSAFCSYGKDQSYNAPVGTAAASAYTTALNLLLGKDSQNKFGIADATVVFWAQKKEAGYDLEQDFAGFFADAPKDDPDQNVRVVRNLYQAVLSGILPKDEGDRFYVLGLSPNAARIAIRFWKTGTVAEFAQKIKRHFDDLEIVKGPKDREFLSLSQLLRSVVLDYKMDNVPPNLAGAVIDSVLDGTPYPNPLMQQCIRRIRAEQQVTRTRAAILKAYLNRLNSNQKEVTVSLDKSNLCPGYRLGRLFAALEKIQEEAQPGINATIRERYYGAASTTPVTVFPQLLKLKNHHLAKLTNPGRKVNLEKMLGEIFAGIDQFPAHLTMEEQARFAIGYYHQRQAFFEPSTKNEPDNDKQ